MLDAHRPIGDESVEARSDELAGNRFVVADATDPPGARLESTQRRSKLLYVANRWRAAASRALGRREREQMNVMVVEAGEEGAAFAVDHALAALCLQALGDRRDAAILDAHVEWRAVADLDA